MAKRRSDDDLVVRSASKVRAKTIRWLVPNVFALGQLTIIDGDPGLGKSLLMLDLAARLSTGRSWPDGAAAAEPAPSIYLTAEDSDDVLAARLGALGADLTRIFFHGCKDRSLDRPLSFPANIGFLDRALARTGARLVVIDPVIAFLDADILSGSDEGIRRALYPLARLAHRQQCAIILIRHLNKRAGSRSLYLGGGSIGFIAQCRSAWLVGREPGAVLPVAPNPPAAAAAPEAAAPGLSPDAADPAPLPGRCVLAQQKNNNGPLYPSLLYQIVAHASGYPTLAWLGSCPLTADELVAIPPRIAVRPRGRAIRFLKRFLAAGPALTEDIWKAGLEHDLFERTLRRAKDDLRIKDEVAWIDGSRRCFWMLEHHDLPRPAKHPGVIAFEQAIDALNKKYPPLTPLDDFERSLVPEPAEPRVADDEDHKDKPPEAAPAATQEPAVANGPEQPARPPSDLPAATETRPLGQGSEAMVSLPPPKPPPPSAGMGIWVPK